MCLNKEPKCYLISHASEKGECVKLEKEVSKNFCFKETISMRYSTLRFFLLFESKADCVIGHLFLGHCDQTLFGTKKCILNVTFWKRKSKAQLVLFP